MAAAIMRVYLETVVNISDPTAYLITKQGLDEFDELKDFSENDMRTLSLTIRRPGDSIPNPRATDSGQPPTIRDPVNLISIFAEKRLVLTAYTAMHQTRTSRLINARTVTRYFIISLSSLRDQELAYNDPVPIDNLLKDTIMSRWLEDLDDYLVMVRGVNKCPLGYVKRQLVAVPAHADDPSIGYANID